VGVLDNLSPQQRSIALYGLPVVGIAALVSMRKKSTAPAAATTNPVVMASQDVLSTSQLAEFESQVSDVVGQIQTSIATLASQPAPAAPAPVIINNPDNAVPVSPPPPPPSIWGANDPSVNPLVSPAPVVYLREGDTLPPATGIGHRYIDEGGFPVV
jgi:hypothetical protein